MRTRDGDDSTARHRAIRGQEGAHDRIGVELEAEPASAVVVIVGGHLDRSIAGRARASETSDRRRVDVARGDRRVAAAKAAGDSRGPLEPRTSDGELSAAALGAKRGGERERAP